MKSLLAVIIGLVVVAAAGCAGGGGSATVAPTVDVTGKWAGTFVSSAGGSTIGIGGGTIELTLKQTGSQVNGNLVVRGAVSDPSGPFEGTVSGNELRMIQPSEWNGIFTVRGDSMSGDVRGGMSHRIYLQRQK
jgi:hypothetical protein